MTLHYGMAVQRNGDATGTEPVDFRKDVEGLFVRAGAMRRGVDALVAGTAGWTFTLNAAWFVTQRATGDGFQLWGNDGAITLSTNEAGAALPTSAPATGLSRLYRVWVRHRANEAGLDLTSVPDAGVEFSAASSSPTLPALPTGATEVAQNLMTSSATSTASTGNTLTVTMPWTASRGGVVHCRTQGELDVVKVLGSAENPILAHLAGALYLCDDGSTVKSIASGQWASYTPTLTNIPGTVTRARWIDLNGMVTAQVRVAVTGAVTGGMRVSLPVAAASADLTAPVGVATAHNGAQTAMAPAFLPTTTLVGVRAPSTAEWSNAVPFTWASGHQYAFTVTYERA